MAVNPPSPRVRVYVAIIPSNCCMSVTIVIGYMLCIYSATMVTRFQSVREYSGKACSQSNQIDLWQPKPAKLQRN